MKKFAILIIDDEESQRESLVGFLKKQGFLTYSADGVDKALELLTTKEIDLVLSDYKMKDKTGEDFLISAKQINPTVPIIIITAYGSVERAVDLMSKGAFHYLQKPIELEELLLMISRVKERQLLISENEMLKALVNESYSFNSIISQSEEMDEVLNTAARVANSKASVLIRGESGTGKELIAKAIHFASGRRTNQFVVVNAAAMPETLFESELFGHEKGAFTGANQRRAGKFEQADKGTLFIDEVGDIPMPVQVKLLRAVQFGQIERLGSNTTLDLDVRILSATNRNLEEMIQNEEFREDLYYRFNVITINIPPLRKRKNDIPILIKFFIDKYSKMNEKKVFDISKEAFDYLIKYDFPGNIRELENIIQRAVVMTRGEIITLSDFPANLGKKTKAIASINPFENLEIGDLNKYIEELEKTLINKALNQTNGNQVKAGELLSISERTIRYKLSRMGS